MGCCSQIAPAATLCRHRTRRIVARRLGCLASGAALLCTLLAVSTSMARDSKSDPQPRIFEVRSARFIAESQLVAALATTPYRLLGEVHDNPEHHAIRARLIVAIAATGARPAVVFEQFNLDRDAAVVAAQAA